MPSVLRLLSDSEERCLLSIALLGVALLALPLESSIDSTERCLSVRCPSTRPSETIVSVAFSNVAFVRNSFEHCLRNDAEDRCLLERCLQCVAAWARPLSDAVIALPSELPRVSPIYATEQCPRLRHRATGPSYTVLIVAFASVALANDSV